MPMSCLFTGIWWDRDWTYLLWWILPYLLDILVEDHGVFRGEKGFIKLPNDIFTWSISIAFSKQRIYG